VAAHPTVSVVLATDELQTLSHVLPYYRAQTVADELELVIVAPSTASISLDSALLEGFVDVRIVEVDSVTPLAQARAAGVRATTAPLVLIGETHALPAPDLVEKLVAAQAEGWAVVVPGFRNANPDGAVSWSNLILTYGRLVSTAKRRELDAVPSYNGCFRRELLLDYGPALDGMLDAGSGLSGELRARGHRFASIGDAVLEHVNVSATSAWVPERFVCGRAFADARMRRWTTWRRVAYVAAAPLLPVPFLRTAFRTWRRLRRETPLLTLPAVFAGSVVWTAGEVCGYARGIGGAAERVTEYELHRLRYIRGASR
jgi:hypothetical protein